MLPASFSCIRSSKASTLIDARPQLPPEPESTMDIYKNPNFTSLVPLPDVLAKWTFIDIAINIPDNCTNHCVPAADFLGYVKGSFNVKTVGDYDLPNSLNVDLFDSYKIKDEGDIPISKFSTLVRDCTEPGLLDDVSNGQIIDWYFSLTQNEEKNDFWWITFRTAIFCYSEFCNGLTWEGNPDISGIGVCSTPSSFT